MVGYPSDHEFWQRQRDQLRNPRIAPITDLVDAVRQRQDYVPYVAAMYGGIEAQILAVVTSPGRQTRAAPAVPDSCASRTLTGRQRASSV